MNSRQAHYRLTGNLRDGVSVFDRRSQQTQLFSPAGKGVWLLSAVFDNYGNRINFIRTNGLLTEVRHSDGYTLTLAWQQSQLMSIDLVTPQRQRLVSCHYDSNDFLAECDTFQFSHLWHEYTSEGFMTRWRDTDKTCVDIRYDPQGRAVSTLSTEGYFDDRFIYNDDENAPPIWMRKAAKPVTGITRTVWLPAAPIRWGGKRLPFGIMPDFSLARMRWGAPPRIAITGKEKSFRLPCLAVTVCIMTITKTVS